MLVFILFLLALAWGSVSTLFWIPEEQMGRGYFQMNALVILGLLSIAIASYILHPFEPFGPNSRVGATALYTSFAGTFLYYGLIWREQWKGARWAAALVVLSLGVAIWEITPQLISAGAAIPAQTLLAQVAVFSSAILLGWSLITMLLGHWYLIAPKLEFTHLVVFCWVLLAAVVFKTIAFGASLWSAAAVPLLTEPQPWRMLTSFEGEAMFFWIRLLWGLVGPLLLGSMALHCARRQSNQSATGILYVLVVGAFLGEITAYYLTLSTGVPV